MKYFLVGLCLVVLGVSIPVITLWVQVMSEPSSDSAINNNINETFAPDPLIAITPLVLDNFENIKTEEVDEIEHISILEDLTGCELQFNKSNKSYQTDLNENQKIFLQVSKKIGQVSLGEDIRTFSDKQLWSVDMNGQNISNLSNFNGIKQNSIVFGNQNVISNDQSKIAFLGPPVSKLHTSLELGSLELDLIFNRLFQNPNITTYNYLAIINLSGDEQIIFFDENFYAVSHEIFWSQDDNFIYTLLRNRDDRSINFISINIDSEELTIISKYVLNDEESNYPVSISSDGSQLALIGKNALKIYDTMSFDLVSELEFPNGEIYNWAWNPQNELFLFTLENDIYLFDTNSDCYKNISSIIHSVIYENQKMIKSSEFGFNSNVYDSYEYKRSIGAQWSNDGSKILVSYKHSSDEFLVDINTWEVTQINISSNDFILSDDGLQLYFRTGDELNVYDVMKNEIKSLVNTKSVSSISHMMLSYDNSKIIYVLNLWRKRSIYGMELRVSEDIHLISFDLNTNENNILLKFSDLGFNMDCSIGDDCVGLMTIDSIAPMQSLKNTIPIVN